MLKKTLDIFQFFCHQKRPASVLVTLCVICYFSAVASAQNPCGKDNIHNVRIKSPIDYTVFMPETDTDNTPVTVELSFQVDNNCAFDWGKIKLKDIFTSSEVGSGATISPAPVAPVAAAPGGGAAVATTKYSYKTNVQRGRKNKYFRLSIFYDEDKIDDPDTGHVDFIVYDRKKNEGDNGIYVLSPKIYDERSLIEKLQELESLLAGKLYIDQSKVAGAIGSLQGASQSVSNFGIQVTTLPLPSVAETSSMASQGNTTLANTSGTLTSQTNAGTTSNTNSSSNTNTSNGYSANTSTNTSMPSVTPTVPTLSNQTPAYNQTQSFGQAASTLLAEQMQLSYEIINIRTLLERAVSDNVDLTTGKGRRQSVLGFRISVDSQKQYEGAIAEVKVKVKNLMPISPPNVVSLIPQEKTYNVATITKNAKQFGFGAIVEVVNIGVSASNSKDTFYLVRDNDTVAMEGTPFDGTDDKPVSASFSWQFRPVLGQKIVQPGTRNVLALLSLPSSDLGNDETTTYVAEVQVQTRWRKYDAKKRTIGSVVGEVSNQYFQALVIPTYKNEFISPEISSIKWEDARNGQALVVVKGKKFVRGTGILAGTSLINSPATGLFISDEENIRFTIPIAQLGVLTDIYLSGRYGSPIKLEERRYMKVTTSSPVTVESVNNSITKITLEIQCPDGCSERFVKNQQPLAVIGNQIFGAIQSPIKVVPGNLSNGKYDKFTLSFLAPTQLLIDNKKLSIKYPFLPSDIFSIEKDIEVADSFSATGVTLLSASENSFQLAVRGTKFVNDSNELSVQVGNEIFKVSDTTNNPKGRLVYLSENLLYLNLNISPKELSSVSNIIVMQETKPLILPIELKAVPIPTPKPEFHQPLPVINQGDSKTIQFKGANFSSIQDMKFEGKTLRFNPKDDGATLELEITTEVTALKGIKKLNYALKDGKTASIEITVN